MSLTPQLKPYEELTRAGRLRRMHGVAVKALASYDLDHPRLVFHSRATNLMYRVTTSTGERLALRVSWPGWRTLDDLRSEAVWLNALASESVVQAPRVLSARTGELVLPVQCAGVSGVRHVTLMTWVPGRLLAHVLTPANLTKMGALFAKLHDHGARWVPPPDFTQRRFEHWLSRGENCALVIRAGIGATNEVPAVVRSLPPSVRAMLDHLHARVEEAYASIDRSDLRVIHCDLWHENIKVHRGVLHPFDFEDTIWGFRAHDIAMAMLDLQETTGDKLYAQLLASFRAGYETGMEWPRDAIEPLQIGRLLWKINWIANRQPEHLLQAIERHLPLFELFLSTGRVTCPPVL